jgi:hypothetical protein
MIPRVIYTYWEGPECPVVEHCIRRLRKSNVDCRLVRLSIADAPQTDGLMDLKACHVADWVRMWYLGTYGGVWMDASCMCAKPVGEWVSFDSDCVQGFSAPWDTSIMENWAFACPAGSPLMAAWMQEFAFAIAVGFKKYKKLRSQSLPSTVVRKMPYLTMHGAFCVVRDRTQTPAYTLRSSTQKGPFTYLAESWWVPPLAVLTLQRYCGQVPFVKLRHTERLWLRMLCSLPFARILWNSPCVHIREMTRPQQGEARYMIILGLGLCVLLFVAIGVFRRPRTAYVQNRSLLV